ncbi:MAG: sigma-70 family RNA polymerase sigma factor [Sphingobacteriales bacterium]|nr:MAG: sigma-70 family RNA polymerase sigma factor [Sphingobacteriales bacterium]
MAPALQHSEEELVSLLKTKSKEGFDYLYKNYSAVLYGLIHKAIPDEQTAQDVLQDVFVKIWNNISQFDPAKGRIYTWMINIARNAAIDKLRSKGEVMKAKIRTDENAVYSMEQGQKTEQRIDTIGLRKIVEGLKPEYQTIINLAYYKGYTLDEISKTLDIPLGTVKTRMRHAMQLLRQNFSN